MDLENPKAFTDRKHFTPTPPETSVNISLGESIGCTFSHCYFLLAFFYVGYNDLSKRVLCAQQKLMALLKHQLNTS